MISPPFLAKSPDCGEDQASGDGDAGFEPDRARPKLCSHAAMSISCSLLGPRRASAPHGTTIDLYPLSYRATSRTAEISTASGVVSSGCPWPLSTHGHRQPDKSGMAGNHPSRSLSFAFGISKGRSAPRSIHSAGSTCCTTTPAARPRKTIPQLVTYASAPERAKTMSSCQTSFRRYGPCSTPTCHPAMRSGRT